MENVEPGQLIGLVFAVALTVLAVVILNWRDEVWTGARLVFAFLRDAFDYFVYVAWDRGSEGDDGGSGTSSEEVVLEQQHQAAPELVLDFEAVLDFLKRHNLTDEQAVDLLALIHRESGDLLSANKIRDIVGGNEAAVKARVASRRPKPPVPKPSPRLDRPVNGW